MTVFQFITLAVATFAAFAVIVLLIDRAKAWGVPRKTVEAEQSESREAHSAIGQHHPSVGELSTPHIISYETDDQEAPVIRDNIEELLFKVGR